MGKPLLLLDADGVLANFIVATLRCLQLLTRYHVDQADYTHDAIFTLDMFDSLPKHKHLQQEAYSLLKQEGGCLGIPVYPDAPLGVYNLRDLVDIVAVTSPFHGSKTWVHEREKWLEHFFEISHKDQIHTSRKELVCGDFLLDDKLETIQKWADKWPKGNAIIWNQRYNQSQVVSGKNIFRVGSWQQLYRLIRDLTSGEKPGDDVRTDVR